MLRLITLITLALVSLGCSHRQEEVTFRNGDVILAGTLTLPAGNGPHPAVVFIHGSGPHSRENYRFYTDLFARHDIATLIYDKRGVGASTGDWRRVHLKDLAEDALAGVRLLKGRKDISLDKSAYGAAATADGSRRSRLRFQTMWRLLLPSRAPRSLRRS